MEFIKPNLVNGPGLSVGQDDGSANKIGLGLIEFGEDCAGSHFDTRHDVARIIYGGSASHMKACNSWQTHGSGTSMELHSEAYVISWGGVSDVLKRGHPLSPKNSRKAS